MAALALVLNHMQNLSELMPRQLHPAHVHNDGPLGGRFFRPAATTPDEVKPSTLIKAGPEEAPETAYSRASGGGEKPSA